jgi:hypothetical protein
MPIGNQREWPRVRESDGTERTSPTGYFKSATDIARSDRNVSGPLRLGTEPRIGPRGALRNGTSDMGMDRISLRGFDPIGTSDTRAPPQEGSDLVSREVRGRNHREG